MTEAGASPIDNGDAGTEQGGAGPGVAEQGGNAGTAARGGEGVGMSGDGNGTPSAGTSSVAGAGTAAGSSSGGAPSGGAPNGGATAGGAPSGGTTSVSGAGGAPAIEPPPNCQSASQSLDTDTCNYVYTCSTQTYFDDCSRDSDGVWNCQCGTFSSATHYFELEGVEALEACETIAHICQSDLSVSSTRTCRTLEQTADGSSCSAHATCGHALDLGPGIVARAVDQYRANCKPTSDYYFADAMTCSCQGGAFDGSNYFVNATSLDVACEPMLGFCTAEEPPVFSGRVCGPLAPYGTVSDNCPAGQNCQGCVMAEECEQTDALTADVSILDQNNMAYQYVVCRPQQGQLHCACETPPDRTGDPTVPAETLAMCSSASSVCPN
jgi:hypothetical protein